MLPVLGALPVLAISGAIRVAYPAVMPFSRRVAPVLCSSSAEGEETIDWDGEWQKTAVKLRRLGALDAVAQDKQDVFRRAVHLKQRYRFFQGLQTVTGLGLAAAVLTWALLVGIYLPGSCVGTPVSDMDKAIFAREVFLPGSQRCGAVSVFIVLFSYFVAYDGPSRDGNGDK